MVMTDEITSRKDQLGSLIHFGQHKLSQSLPVLANLIWLNLQEWIRTSSDNSVPEKQEVPSIWVWHSFSAAQPRSGNHPQSTHSTSQSNSVNRYLKSAKLYTQYCKNALLQISLKPNKYGLVMQKNNIFSREIWFGFFFLPTLSQF